MRVAMQTISWGPHPDNIETMLKEVVDAGYGGVELAQHPKVLGPVPQLYELLQNRLTLVGVSGGALSEKIAFVEEFIRIDKEKAGAPGIYSIAPNAATALGRERSPYVYVDEWEGKRSEDALESNVALALHPHMFKSVQTAQEAENLLKQFPKLRFLPDTAHLTVAGEDVVSTLERNFDQIAAIHLKDWTAEFGRAYQFYSRGFVELGKGDVVLGKILTFLKSRNYQGWLVVEQDASSSPLMSAKSSRVWLRKEYSI
jgi:inosose dehydratase